MQYVVIVGAIVVFVGVGTQNFKRHRRLAPIRMAAQLENVTFRVDVDVKLMMPSGHWSLKTLGGMELIVREHLFQVTLRSPKKGAALGSEWFFDATKCNIDTSFEPSPKVLRRKWIVARGHEPAGKFVEIALWNRSAQTEIWNSLVAAGAWSSGIATFE